MSDERMPPHSLDAERAVLGALLVQPDLLDVVRPLLAPVHFFRAAHRTIYDGMLDLHAERIAIDALTLKEMLLKRRKLDEVGGAGYVMGLTDGMPRSTNVEAYARIVREKAALRTVIAAGTQIVARAYEADEDAGAVLQTAEAAFLALSADVVPGDLVTASDLAREAFAVVERLVEARHPITGVSTGLPSLDRLTLGLQDGDLIIIGGRPSQGKTALALQIALHLARVVPVAFFSLEMSRQALELRALSQLAHVDHQALRCGQVSSLDQQRIGAALDALAGLDWHVDDTSALAPLEVRSKARRLKARHGLGAVVIDYLQLMTGPKAENRTQEVSALSRSLKGVARDLNVPVVVLSQLSRASEQRADRRPTLADLRDSGAIEQDADLVWLVHRPVPADGGESQTVELIVAKQRNGPTGTVELVWVGPRMAFAELTRAHAGA
jgi:replicative DNA helicase